MSSTKLPVVKVFVAGEGGVGKTTLITRFVDGIFNANTIMTIGANFYVKKVKTAKDQELNLQIWDLGGEERFRFILKSYIKGASVGIVCFDSTRFSSFRNLTQGWLTTIREILPTAPLILIGTKTDLPEANTDPTVYEETMKEFDFKALIFTSSKNGQNVEKAFQLVADLTNFNFN